MNKEEKLEKLTAKLDKISKVRGFLSFSWSCYKAVSPAQRVQSVWSYAAQPCFDWASEQLDCPSISQFGYGCGEAASFYSDPVGYSVGKAVGYGVRVGVKCVTQQIISRVDNEAIIMLVEVGGQMASECLTRKITSSATSKAKTHIDELKSKAKIHIEELKKQGPVTASTVIKKLKNECKIVLTKTGDKTSASKATPIETKKIQPTKAVSASPVQTKSSCTKDQPVETQSKFEKVLKGTLSAISTARKGIQKIAIPAIDMGLAREIATTKRRIVRLKTDIRIEEINRAGELERKGIADDLEAKRHEVAERTAAEQEEINSLEQQLQAMKKKLEEEIKQTMAATNEINRLQIKHAMNGFIFHFRMHKVSNAKLHELLVNDGFFLDEISEQISREHAAFLTKKQYRRFIASYLYQNSQVFASELIENASQVLFSFFKNLVKNKDKITSSVADLGVFGGVASSSNAEQELKSSPQISMV